MTPWFGTLSRIVTLLVTGTTVVRAAGRAGRTDTGSQDGTPPSLLLATLLLFLLPTFLIGGLGAPGARGMVQIFRILSLGPFGGGGGLVSSIPSRCGR